MGTFNENISILANSKNDIATSLRRKNIELSYTEGFDKYSRFIGQMNSENTYDWSSIGYDGMPKFLKKGFNFVRDRMLPYYKQGINYMVDESTNTFKKYSNFTASPIFPAIKFPNATSMQQVFFQSPIMFIGDIYFPDRDVSVYRMFDQCYTLKYVGNMFTGKCTQINAPFNECKSLRKIKSIDFASVEQDSLVCGATAALSSLTVKNIGMKDLSSDTVVNLDFSHTPSWGVNCRFDPNAHQTIVDSLINFSCDRTYHNYSGTFRIELPTNYYKLLTRSEARAILAKGYVLFTGYWLQRPNGTWYLDHEDIYTENHFPETL